MDNGTLPSLAQLIEITCFAEVARRIGVPRGRIWRLRNGAALDETLVEPLARVLYRDVDYIRAVIEADRQRKAAA